MGVLAKTAMHNAEGAAVQQQLCFAEFLLFLTMPEVRCIHANLYCDDMLLWIRHILLHYIV
jgi:hypothetical protein